MRIETVDALVASINGPGRSQASLIDALFFDELAFFLPSARFIETVYLPYAERQKRRSTFLGYRNIWKRYIKPDGDRALREFRTFECEQM